MSENYSKNSHDIPTYMPASSWLIYQEELSVWSDCASLAPEKRAPYFLTVGLRMTKETRAIRFRGWRKHATAWKD